MTCGSAGGFVRRELVDAPLVPVNARERLREERAHHLQRLLRRVLAGTDRDHVRIVVLTAKLGGLNVPGERGAHPGHLVRRDLFAVTGAADHDAQAARFGGHRLARGEAERRIVVVDIEFVGTVVHNVVALGGETVAQVLLQFKSSMVRSYVNAHRSILPYQRHCRGRTFRLVIMTDERFSAPTPASGIDIAALDAQIRPQDDLYRHVNGRWLSTFEIPADRAADGAFRQLADQAEIDVRQIITEAGAGRASEHPTAGQPSEHPTDTVADQIGALYASFMAADQLESLRYEPLRAELARIDAAADHAELLSVLADLQRSGGPALVRFWVDTDRVYPDQYATYVMQAGLGLPDEAYYREDTHAETLASYQAHIGRVLRALRTDLRSTGDPDAGDADAARIVALETKIAAAHWDRVRDRDAQATYNPLSIAELSVQAPGFDWGAWAAGVGVPESALDRIIVREPDYFAGLGSLWPVTDLTEWKLWASFHLVRKFSAYLHEEAVLENFDFYGRVLTGATELRERWKRGVALVEGGLGEAVGQLYVAKHFPASHKERMDELVANLIEAYRQSITALDWMSEETRARALAKLDTFTPKIGYPVRWRDYSSLSLVADDLIGNVKRSNEFDHAYELGKLGGPVDRDEWFMTPQTVNAYYNPGMNEIVFPAAILQPPFFDAAADDAANYGGIGAVIGHEIGHGFDDQGSRYDGEGRLVDWWTEQDRAEFEARTKALIAQYDAFVPEQLGPEGQHVNGALTIGENIGDLGGLAIALRAYEIALRDRGIDDVASAPVIDGLTGAQRVFLSWAQVWQQKIRDEALIQRMSVDPHSPNEFRCNGIVSNIDEFYDAFSVSPGDALYVAPEDRVRIW